MTLTRLMNPASIAVFGGSAAEETIRQCDRMGFTGEIWPVHPRRSEMLGRRVYGSVEELPGSPDAAYLAVSRDVTIEIVRALANAGAGGAVCFANGFAEAGEEGRALQRQLLEASGDMPMLGPNCYGLVNYVNGAMLWPDQQGGRPVDDGVAIVTMSSNLAFNITMQKRGLPIAHMVSLGNRLKFDLSDAIYTFAQLSSVTAIGLHIEGISDPVAFAEAIDFARSMHKPVVALKTGKSDVGKQMVYSHTAALAGSDELVDALFERVGVARVNSLESMMETLKVLHVHGPLDGLRIGVMSTSGGDGSLVSDAAEDIRLSIPALSPAGIDRVRAIVHERVVAANPLDYQTFDWDDSDRLAAIYTAFLADEFDMSLCLLDHPREDRCDPAPWQPAVSAIVAATRQTGVPTAVMATLAENMPESLASDLIEEGIVPLAGVEAGLAGVQAAADIGRALARQPAPALTRVATGEDDRQPSILDEAASKEMLNRYGVPVPAFRVVSTAEEAIDAAGYIGYPVAVKALGVAHKTERGAVRLGLCSADAVAGAIGEMGGLAERFLIESMIEDSVAELIVGVARDSQFGPYLIVGAGGVLVELVRDSRRLLLPFSQADARDAVSRLTCAPLLQGFRGGAPADVDAVAETMVAVGELAHDRRDTITELDINPLMVLPRGQGVVAVDALICLKH